MPKPIVLGNGNMSVCLDDRARLRDLYFPHVGLENHISTHDIHRIGVWVDGKISWLKSENWNIELGYYENKTMMTDITAKNKEIQIELNFNDIVYNEKNIFVREIKVKNLAENSREVKIFFDHQFEISEVHRGDTAYFEPDENRVVHYRGRRSFLINLKAGRKNFDDYTIGLYKVQGQEGTYKDAEDGELSKNPVEHGSVSSCVGITLDVNQSKTIHYWMTVGKSVKEVYDLDKYIEQKSPQHLIKTTSDFWNAWVNKKQFNFYGLSEEVVDLFSISQFVIRSNVDNNGAIVASLDSDMLWHGRDTYSYVWPRDAALIAEAMDGLGDYHLVKKFFQFSCDVLTEEGYFMHKYRPDKAIGSSWHPWIRNGKRILPIQEDETALVLYQLWNHYRISKDIEFIESIYNDFIKKTADFMVEYRDGNGMPKPSYDLWEEKYGVSTFTCSTVYGALTAASNFAELLGKTKESNRYNKAAEEIKEGIINKLYDEEKGYFCKLIDYEGGDPEYDRTIDMSSVYGIFKFGVLDKDDKRLKKAIKIAEKELWLDTKIGGMIRYKGDKYYKDSNNLPGNSWFITTLWLAQYYIKTAKEESDLDKVKKCLQWCAKNSMKSGILPEQVDPHTGEPQSATPLTWSHAEFTKTVIQYLEKLEDLGICQACYPVKLDE